MISGETEGAEYDAMPAELCSIVFRAMSTEDGGSVLVADIEERDYFGNKRFVAYGHEVECLSESLYEGCDNDAWCVRIGDEVSQAWSVHIGLTRRMLSRRSIKWHYITTAVF